MKENINQQMITRAGLLVLRKWTDYIAKEMANKELNPRK